jgi:hypothetical protein
MNYLQIETNVEFHRDRLLREAEAERMANQVRSASATRTDAPEQPARRRGLSVLWRRLATQTA